MTVMKYLQAIFFLVVSLMFATVLTGADVSSIEQGHSFFEENKGQFVDMKGNPVPEVLFKVSYTKSGSQLDAYITQQGITYCSSTSLEETTGTEVSRTRNSVWERVDVALVGARITPGQVVTQRARTTKKHYYLGHCPDGIRDVNSYEQVRIKEVYPGIDWVLHSNGEGDLKYDFEVGAGVDPSNIRLRYKSRLPLEIGADGALVMHTAQGNIKELAPVSYQGNLEVSTRFKQKRIQQAKSIGGYLTDVSYELGKYNKQRALTIDPALQWATLIEGESDQRFPAVASDNIGNTFLVSESYALLFPVTDNGTYFQGTNQGSSDGTVLKMSADGVFEWATYYGGSSVDVFNDLVVDQSNNLIALGRTQSSNLPTENADQSSNSGGRELFLVKFSNNGERIFATYYGGRDDDYAGGLALDAEDNIYIAGVTKSPDLPIPVGTTPFQGALNGTADAFVTRYSSAGELEWSTYYGGSGVDGNLSAANSGTSAIACDGASIYFTGVTQSSDLPLNNAIQTSNAGASDAFVARFDLNGNMIWSTYLGGDALDIASRIALDNSGDVYICGYTLSSNYPTRDPLQPNLQGDVDAFLTKLDADGNMVWSTYIGGRVRELGTYESLGMVVDDCDNIYMSYSTVSDDIITASDISSPCVDEYVDDAVATNNTIVLSRFSADGELLWVTYYGSGMATGYESDLAIDYKGNLFLAGAWKYRGGEDGSASLKEMDGAYYYDSFVEAYNMYVARFGITYEVVNTVNCDASCASSATVTMQEGCPSYSYTWQGETFESTTGEINLSGICAGEQLLLITPSCMETDTIVLNGCGPVDVFVPSSFTPNGDDINDVFIPVFSDTVGLSYYTMEVYNRWGEEMFSTEDITEGWDGTIDSQVVPSGVYTCTITYEEETSSDRSTIRKALLLLK